MTILIAIMVAFALAIIGHLAVSSARKITASNGAGTYQGGRMTRTSEGVINTRYLIVKQGASQLGILVCGATDAPLGIATDEADAVDDPIAVLMPGGADNTALVVPAVDVSAGDSLYTALDGKVTNVPEPGCYRVGTALNNGYANIVMSADLQGFGSVYASKQIAFAGKATMAGGAASEAVTITGLLATDVVCAVVTDNASNDDVVLIEAKPSGDTLTLLFSEDPTAGVVVDYMVLR